MLTSMEGRVYLIGTGSGGLGDLTPRARAAISRADVLIASNFSQAFVESCVSGQRLETGFKTPVERAEAAVRYALEGLQAAIISPGDPGVYAIASTFFSYLKENNLTISIEIVPGITTASYASALLGSPLGHDFAVISLADQAGSWSLTHQKLVAAARAGYVLVLYNPVGKIGSSRIGQVVRELSMMLGPETPAGIVSNAGTDCEQAVVTRLESLHKATIHPDTLIIIGNSTTYVYDGWMVTPRSYQPGLGY